MSSHLQYNDINLQSLVSNINNNLYSIPKFQRDFVWRSNDIASLGDSLLRQYPISSLLLMPMNGNLELGYDCLKTYDISTNNIDTKKGFYILDGQQRITSIAKLFLNLDNNKRYFFDLLSILAYGFPEEDLTKYCEFFKSKNITDDLCRSFNKTTSDENAKQNYRFISGKTIIVENKTSSLVQKFIKYLDQNIPLSEDQKDNYNDYLTLKLNSLSSYSISCTTISANSDLGLICRVFEKVNSTGISLSTFDLINAKSFSNDKYTSGLATFLNKDIRERIDFENNKEFHKAISSFLDYSNNNNTFKRLSAITRIIAISDFIYKDKAPYITNTQMLLLPSSHWFEKWEQYRITFYKFINWLAEEKIYNLGAKSFYEYICGLIIQYPDLLNNNLFKNHIKKQALYLSIYNKSFTQTDLETFNNIKNYGLSLLNSFEYTKYDIDRPVLTVTENSIKEHLPKCKKDKKSFKAIMYIMADEKHENKFCEDISGEIIKSRKSYDCHHLIPKSQNKGKNVDLYNSIINFAPLNPESNQKDVKNKYINEYINEYIKVHGLQTLQERCINNLIPFNYLKNEEEFLNKRKEMIAKYLCSYFQK